VGDHEAAARVELSLPETDVYSGPGLAADTALAAACCGTKVVEKMTGCCGVAA